VSDDDVKGYEATEDKLEREPQRGARDEGQAPWSLDLPPLPIRVARPRCKECGLQKRGPILDYVGVDGKECAYEVKDTWTACFKCDMGEHTSQVTRDNASGTVNRRHNMAREWEGREDEANAWEHESPGDPVAAVSDGHLRFSRLPNYERGIIERDRRPRAVIEEGPAPGSADVVFVLTQAALWLAGESVVAQSLPPRERADSRVGHTWDGQDPGGGPGVPAFSIHDRYTEDTWLPGDAAPSTWEHMSGSGEPRRPYLRANIIGQMLVNDDTQINVGDTVTLMDGAAGGGVVVGFDMDATGQHRLVALIGELPAPTALTTGDYELASTGPDLEVETLLHDFSNATGAAAEPLTMEKLQEAITAFEALPPANALPLMWTAAWPDDEST
jgi:hypothetical protein